MILLYAFNLPLFIILCSEEQSIPFYKRLVLIITNFTKWWFFITTVLDAWDIKIRILKISDGGGGVEAKSELEN